MSEYLKFRGNEYGVVYDPYAALRQLIQIWRDARDVDTQLSAICEGHWWFISLELARISFRYAIPTAVVDYMRRTREKWSPDDVRLPSFMPEPPAIGPGHTAAV